MEDWRSILEYHYVEEYLLCFVFKDCDACSRSANIRNDDTINIIISKYRSLLLMERIELLLSDWWIIFHLFKVRREVICWFSINKLHWSERNTLEIIRESLFHICLEDTLIDIQVSSIELDNEYQGFLELLNWVFWNIYVLCLTWIIA